MWQQSGDYFRFQTEFRSTYGKSALFHSIVSRSEFAKFRCVLHSSIACQGDQGSPKNMLNCGNNMIRSWLKVLKQTLIELGRKGICKMHPWARLDRKIVFPNMEICIIKIKKVVIPSYLYNGNSWPTNLGFMLCHSLLMGVLRCHYSDVIMSGMVSQITSLAIVYSTVYSGAQMKENSKAPRHWPLWGEFTDDRWIPRTKCQLRQKCFHLMASSCSYCMLRSNFL